jgi:ABC-type antimicrobial peptide transport system permease subunit
MSIIAALILAISCFNFINMAIAVGIKRYKEAGIKKVLGSSKKTIVLQFLTESVLICMIALFFSFILLETFLPLYNQMEQIHLAVDYGNFIQILNFILFAAVVGIIAAIYPALLLGSTSPVKILNRTANGSQRIGFSRQGLIVFQFIITILLTVGLFVFSKQSNYINSKDIGLNRYNVLSFIAPNSILEQRNAFISDLNAIPEISSVSWCSQNPIFFYVPTNDVVWEGKQANEKRDFSILKTDAAFISTMKVRLASGRFFSDSIASDSGSYVLNEEAVKCMHLTDPVGKTISVNNKKGTIVGVVNNFNSVPLNSPYGPVIIINQPSQANTILIRFSGYEDVSRKKIEMVYKKYEQYIPFSCGLIEDSFNYLNILAKNAATVLSLLSILALFLSCMGLFGLASFTIETRTKEIGIRKSNGASTISILRMFLKVYNKWILIASCIALPLAFLAWNTLLSTFFAFRIQFPMASLVITPLLVMLISWITVIWQSWRAANKNPVEALRYE